MCCVNMSWVCLLVLNYRARKKILDKLTYSALIPASEQSDENGSCILKLKK
jgi:hypothetical protein